MLQGFTRGSFKLFLSGKGMSFRTGRYFLESAFLGLVTGIVTATFHGLIVGFDKLLAGITSVWIWLLLPPLGAIAGTFLIAAFSHIRHARGTDSAVRAFHQDEDIPRMVIPVKSVASILTVGCGGSAGYEGPVTLLGAACARVVSRLLKLDRHAARILLAAGTGAGIAALFRAPLAGALFGAEIFYSSSDVEHEAILPSFIASAVSYTVFAFCWGWEPLFKMPTIPFDHVLQLVPYFVLAIVVTFGARIYVMVFRSIETSFTHACGPAWVKVAIGGLVAATFALFIPGVRGTGYPLIQQFLLEADKAVNLPYFQWLPLMCFVVFLAKVVATSFTVGSGGSGGVFAPAIVCGAALGAGTGLFFKAFLPAWTGVDAAEFALVGMAGFLASCVRVPMTAIVMVAEISGNHGLLLPTMWVVGISFWLNNGWSLYRSQVHDREASPVHGDVQLS